MVKSHEISNGKSPIIFFDGTCNLCNGFIRFVIKHDKRGVLRFGLLQSEKVQELLKPFGMFAIQITTVVLLENDRIYTGSDVPVEDCKTI